MKWLAMQLLFLGIHFGVVTSFRRFSPTPSLACFPNVWKSGLRFSPKTEREKTTASEKVSLAVPNVFIN